LGLGPAQLFPLHGLLGNFTLIDSFAAKMGLTRNEWLENEFIPHFGAAMAEAQYRYGILFSSHSQNTLLAVNPKTGKITKIVFRDLNDVHWDLQNILYGEPNRTESIARLRDYGLAQFGQVNSIGIESNDNNRINARNPGRNMGAYAYQSIYQCNPRDQAYLIESFLNFYVKAASEVTGIKIKTDVTYRQGNGKTSSKSRVLLIQSAQQVYNIVSQERVPILTAKDFQFDQRQLYRQFSQANSKSEVAWLIDVRELEPEGRERFAKKDNVIYLMGEGNTVEAMTLEP
jgi:hypothetical protein